MICWLGLTNSRDKRGYDSATFVLSEPLCFSFVLFGDVSRLLEPLDFKNFSKSSKIGYKSAAFISPRNSTLKSESVSDEVAKVSLDRLLLEKSLGEALSHRYQATGKVIAYITREWRVLDVSSNFFLKIRDCAPDELSSSSFIRFEIWDEGTLNWSIFRAYPHDTYGGGSFYHSHSFCSRE